MSNRALFPAEYAVLGLLAIKPMHGYEMARYFDRDELAEVCPIEPSLLYMYMRNLEQRALVEGREERVGNRPPRKIHRLTPAGREALFAWLYQPVQRLREIRLDFLLKLYFLGQFDPPAERALLARQIDVCEAYSQRLTARVADASGFERLVVMSRLSAAEATSNWLRAYAWEIDQHIQPNPDDRQAVEPPRREEAE